MNERISSDKVHALLQATRGSSYTFEAGRLVCHTKDGSYRIGTVDDLIDGERFSVVLDALADLLDAREEIDRLTKERDHLAAERQRLWDLVRHQRGELHEEELITNEEYAALAFDHDAVARLESYDEVRAERERLAAEVKRLRRIEEPATALIMEARRLRVETKGHLARLDAAIERDEHEESPK